MSTNSSASGLVASNLDLAAVAGYVVLVTVAFAFAGDLPTAVAVPLALPVFLFAPGYAVVTAIAPGTANPTSADTPGDRLGVRQTHDGLSPLERVTLSVVASVAVVPLVAFALNFVVGVALLSTLVGVAAVTVVAALVAAPRRNRPSPDAFAGAPGGSGSGRSLLDGVPTDAITLGCATIALLLLVSSATMAMSGEEATGTEFYLVTETADGSYEASDYPTNLTAGSATEYALGIEQHSGDVREYTIVAQLEDRSGTGENATVDERRELDRFSATVEPGNATVETYDVTPTTAGDDLALTFLLYEGDAPEDPTRQSAHRVVHIPVDVS